MSVVPGLRIAGAAGYLDVERVAREVDSVDRIVAILYKLGTGRAESLAGRGTAPAARYFAIVSTAGRLRS